MPSENFLLSKCVGGCESDSRFSRANNQASMHSAAPLCIQTMPFVVGALRSTTARVGAGTLGIYNHWRRMVSTTLKHSFCCCHCQNQSAADFWYYARSDSPIKLPLAHCYHRWSFCPDGFGDATDLRVQILGGKRV